MTLVWLLMAPKPHLYFLECVKTSTSSSLTEGWWSLSQSPGGGGVKESPRRGMSPVAGQEQGVQWLGAMPLHAEK